MVLLDKACKGAGCLAHISTSARGIGNSIDYYRCLKDTD